jgi:hypothetical protein
MWKQREQKTGLKMFDLKLRHMQVGHTDSTTWLPLLRKLPSGSERWMMSGGGDTFLGISVDEEGDFLMMKSNILWGEDDGVSGR